MSLHTAAETSALPLAPFHALPDAVELLRRLRRSEGGSGTGVKISAADPLNLDGILTPEPRIPSQARRRVLVA